MTFLCVPFLLERNEKSLQEIPRSHFLVVLTEHESTSSCQQEKGEPIDSRESKCTCPVAYLPIFDNYPCMVGSVPNYRQQIIPKLF